MLVLTRKPGQSFHVGDHLIVTVAGLDADGATLRTVVTSGGVDLKLRSELVIHLSLQIGDDITIKLLDIEPGQARIGIDAPKGMPIHRGESYEEHRQKHLARASV